MELIEIHMPLPPECSYYSWVSPCYSDKAQLTLLTVFSYTDSVTKIFLIFLYKTAKVEFIKIQIYIYLLYLNKSHKWKNKTKQKNPKSQIGQANVLCESHVCFLIKCSIF